MSKVFFFFCEGLVGIYSKMKEFASEDQILPFLE